MWKGHFLFSRSYIHEMLPLLGISGDRIGRRLKKLSQVGLIDLRRKLTSKGQRLYAQLSRLYWAEEDRANRKAGSHTSKTPRGENASGDSAPIQPAFAPTDHIYDHEETQPPTPPADAVPEAASLAAALGGADQGPPAGPEASEEAGALEAPAAPGDESTGLSKLWEDLPRTEQLRQGCLRPERKAEKYRIMKHYPAPEEVNKEEAEADLARIRAGLAAEELDDDPFDEREAVAAGSAPGNSNRGPA